MVLLIAFVRTFSKREVPDDVPEVRVSFRDAGSIKLGALLAQLGLAPSVPEANRLVKQRAVEIDGEVVESGNVELRDGMVIRVGKHKFARVVDSDK